MVELQEALDDDVEEDLVLLNLVVGDDFFVELLCLVNLVYFIGVYLCGRERR